MLLGTLHNDVIMVGSGVKDMMENVEQFATWLRKLDDSLNRLKYEIDSTKATVSGNQKTRNILKKKNWARCDSKAESGGYIP